MDDRDSARFAFDPACPLASSKTQGVSQAQKNAKKNKDTSKEGDPASPETGARVDSVKKEEKSKESEDHDATTAAAPGFMPMTDNTWLVGLCWGGVRKQGALFLI